MIAQVLVLWALTAFSREHTLIIGIIHSKYLSVLQVLALTAHTSWTPFDRSRDWPELGPRFNFSEEAGRAAVEAKESGKTPLDLDWSAIIKRTFEAYIRGERPNMYGENILW